MSFTSKKVVGIPVAVVAVDVLGLAAANGGGNRSEAEMDRVNLFPLVRTGKADFSLCHQFHLREEPPKLSRQRAARRQGAFGGKSYKGPDKGE